MQLWFFFFLASFLFFFFPGVVEFLYNRSFLFFNAVCHVFKAALTESEILPFPIFLYLGSSINFCEIENEMNYSFFFLNMIYIEFLLLSFGSCLPLFSLSIFEFLEIVNKNAALVIEGILFRFTSRANTELVSIN